MMALKKASQTTRYECISAGVKTTFEVGGLRLTFPATDLSFSLH